MSVEILPIGYYTVTVATPETYTIEVVTPEAYTVTVAEPETYTIELSGAQGPPGPPGSAGPNEVTTSTLTNINGILAGNGTTIQEAQMSANKLLGRSTAGVGDIEEITIGTGLSLSAGTLSSTSVGLASGTSSGTDTYTTTISNVTGYVTNDTYVVKFTNANTGASTININGLGAKTLVKNVNSPLVGGDISAGQEMIIIYDGTNFQVLGIAPNQMFAFVTNAESTTITKGQVVYAFGAAGDRMSVKLASNTADLTSAKTIGLVYSSSISANGTGYIITQGVIQNLNLGAYTAGDTLYLGVTPGTFTSTKPYAPNHLVYVGIVERANAGNGQIFVRCQNGYELEEIHDIDLVTTPPVNNDILTYVTGSPNLWKPRSVTTILGYTPPTTYNQNTTPTGTGTSSIPTGSLWFHSDTGIQYTYYYDGNTYQWTQETLPLGPQGPQGANGTNTVNSLTATTFNGLLKGNGSTLSATTVGAELGYTAENVANKENVTLDNSSTKYPTNNLVKTSLDSFADDVDYAIMINQRILFNF